MSTQKGPDGGVQRRQYVVDAKLQYGVSLMIFLALLGISILWILGIFVIVGNETLSSLEPDEVRVLMFKINGIYFALGAGITVVLTLLLTHRVAGPAYVMGRALRQMQSGDYDQRLTLRHRDHLKPMCAELQALADGLKRARADRRAALADLERCLAEGDTDAARELVVKLRSVDGDAETIAPATPAPVEAVAADS